MPTAEPRCRSVAEVKELLARMTVYMPMNGSHVFL